MKFYYPTVLLVLGINYSFTSPTICPHSFMAIHKSCYYFSSTAGTWAEVNKACRDMGAQLLSIETAEESSALNQYILYQYNTAVNFWTSGSDVQTEGQFIWMNSNERFNYTRWCNLQPDNSGGIEHCVHLARADNYRICWNDIRCNSREVNFENVNSPLYFVCEHDVNHINRIMPDSFGYRKSD